MDRIEILANSFSKYALLRIFRPPNKKKESSNISSL